MTWWKEGLIYQIYPRSFQDSNDDGVGDLPGIIQRLDYLAWLGVDGVWISPIYPSPMADFGYDVSDYTGVHPLFGTLADAERLIEEAHARDLRIILDFVPSHTSDQHPWFIESRQSRDNPKRDWYLWKDPAPDGGPPNNWLGRFDGKSGWEYDEKTGQYYFHSFLKKQPDLNWRHPDLREAMLDNLRFWFDRGVDGFRVDVSYRAMKDADFRDNPPNPDFVPGEMDPHKRLLETYTKNVPDIHKFNRWLREVADEYEDRVMIGEINLDIPQLVKHYGTELDEFHLPFNFRFIYEPWGAEAAQDIVERFESHVPEGAWPNYVLGSHDFHRFASRTSPAQARVGMMMLLTLRGTPTVYYGEELGMLDGEIPPDRVQDPWEKNVPGLDLGRDPERTPMHWSAAPNAGFTSEGVEPWLPLAKDYPTRNVEAQREDPRSELSLTRALIELRRAEDALHLGAYRTLASPQGVFAYVRGEAFAIVLNFTEEPHQVDVPGAQAIVLSTHMDDPDALSEQVVTLRPDEGLIVRL